MNDWFTPLYYPFSSFSLHIFLSLSLLLCPLACILSYNFSSLSSLSVFLSSFFLLRSAVALPHNQSRGSRSLLLLPQWNTVSSQPSVFHLNHCLSFSLSLVSLFHSLEVQYRSPIRNPIPKPFPTFSNFLFPFIHNFTPWRDCFACFREALVSLKKPSEFKKP